MIPEEHGRRLNDIAVIQALLELVRVAQPAPLVYLVRL